MQKAAQDHSSSLVSAPWSTREAVQHCADTFNGAVAAAALSAAWDIGILDELAVRYSIDVQDFANEHDAHLETLRAILTALSARRIVAMDTAGTTVSRGMLFDEAFANIGFYYWLTRGCGELFTDLTQLTLNKTRAERDMQRNSSAISLACRSIAQSYFDPPLRQMLRDLSFQTIADLGCGSADRIIMLAERDPTIKAIGIDVANGALAVSKAAVAEAGLDGRVTLIQDDVLSISPRPEYEDVELVTCFLMGHDFWPRDRCVESLRRLRKVFPKARNLILGDTCRSTGVDGPDLPIFTTGFELVHAVMGKYLPTYAEWLPVIEESGWVCAEKREIEHPAFSFIFRLTPS
jgi:SAM-dependent methyltransferase